MDEQIAQLIAEIRERRLVVADEIEALQRETHDRWVVVGQLTEIERRLRALAADPA